MPKYIYKPVSENVFNVWKENVGKDSEFINSWPEGIPVELCVTASDENECLNIRNLLTHNPSWKLDRIE